MKPAPKAGYMVVILRRWLNPVSSIVTAVGVAIAVSTYYDNVRTSNLDHANQIRQDLRTVGTSAVRLASALNEENALVDASVEIAGEFSALLGEGAMPEDFWGRLKDRDFLRSAIVAGWNASYPARQVDSLVDGLQVTSRSLHGKLQAVSAMADALLMLARRSYGPPLFISIMSPDLMIDFSKEGEKQKTVRALTTELSLWLQRNSAHYFKHPYLESIIGLQDVIDNTTRLLVNLDDKPLIAASRAQVKSGPASTTLTVEATDLLEYLKGDLSVGDFAKGIEKLKKVEAFIGTLGPEFPPLSIPERPPTSP